MSSRRERRVDGRAEPGIESIDRPIAGGEFLDHRAGAAQARRDRASRGTTCRPSRATSTTSATPTAPITELHGAGRQRSIPLALRKSAATLPRLLLVDLDLAVELLHGRIVEQRADPLERGDDLRVAGDRPCAPPARGNRAGTGPCRRRARRTSPPRSASRWRSRSRRRSASAPAPRSAGAAPRTGGTRRTRCHTLPSGRAGRRGGRRIPARRRSSASTPTLARSDSVFRFIDSRRLGPHDDRIAVVDAGRLQPGELELLLVVRLHHGVAPCRAPRR